VRRNRFKILLAAVLVAAVTVPVGAGEKARTRYLFAGSFGSSMVTVFDADTLEKVASIPTEVNGTCCVYATPNGRTVMAVAGLSAFVTAIDVRTLSVVRQTPVESDQFTESGSEIEDRGKTFWATTNDTSPNIFGIDIATGQVRTALTGVESRDFQASRDGEALYLLTGDKLVIRSTRTGKVVDDSLSVAGTRAYVSHDDRTLYLQTGALSTGGAEQIEVVDVSDRTRPRLVTTMPLPGAGWYGAFSPDGRQLWVAGADNGLLTVFDLERNAVARTISLGNAYGVGVALSDNGRAYVSVTSTPVPPVPGASTALHIAGVVPGAALPATTTAGGLAPGEIWVYDAKSMERLDVPPLKLPSAAFAPTVIDGAPRFAPGKVRCTSQEFVWSASTGCVPVG
jgi:DNA-binding beta-propeller fold protein YncE